jgi:hypothetical protein
METKKLWLNNVIYVLHNTHPTSFILLQNITKGTNKYWFSISDTFVIQYFLGKSIILFFIFLFTKRNIFFPQSNQIEGG